jgi:hypothetical protein
LFAGRTPRFATGVYSPGEWRTRAAALENAELLAKGEILHR